MNEPSDKRPGTAEKVATCRVADDVDERVIADRLDRHRPFDAKPAAEAVAGRIDPPSRQLVDEAPKAAVLAIVDLLEIGLHRRGAPRWIAGLVRDSVPV